MEQIRGVLDAVRCHLESLGQGAERLGAVEIALAEALNNIAEHAYAGQAPGPVHLRAEARGVLLRVVLLDRGRPPPGHALPPGLHHDLNVATEALPEGGFGWLLIRNLAEDVSYSRSSDENRLTLIFRLN